MSERSVRRVVEGVLDETATALARKYGHDTAKLHAHAEDLLRRFANPALLDTVERVARDPLRKLAPGERIVSAARCCQAQGVEPRYLAFAAAAAIRYDHPSDPSARTVQELLCSKGWDAVLHEVCGVAAKDPFVALVKGSGPAATPGKAPQS